jgi:hypothetical protein
MRAVRLLAMMAAIVASAGCSSKSAGSDPTTSSEGGTDAGDGSSADPPDAGCPAAQQCGSQCCPADQACGKDATGALFCALACATSGECTMAAPCCSPRGIAASGDAGEAPGVCIPSSNDEVCLCSKGTDCASAACAPSVDASGNPTGPYVCVPITGDPYAGCSSIFQCYAPYCCVTDTNGNPFCATPCTSDSSCGAGHCDSFDFSASKCTGMTRACGI